MFNVYSSAYRRGYLAAAAVAVLNVAALREEALPDLRHVTTPHHLACAVVYLSECVTVCLCPSVCPSVCACVCVCLTMWGCGCLQDATSSAQVSSTPFEHGCARGAVGAASTHK